MIPLEILLLAITVITNIILGIIILIRLPKSLYSWAFLAITLSVAIWAIGDIIILYSNNQNLTNFGSYLFYIAPLFTPFFVWLFAHLFPLNEPPKKIKVFIWLTPLLAYSVASIIGIYNFVDDIIINPDGLNTITVNPKGFALYVAILLAIFTSALMLLMQKYRNSRGRYKIQISYTYFGILISSTLALLSNAILPVLGIPNYIWLGPIFTLIAVILISIAMVRHKLFDFSFAAIKTIIYILTLFIVSLIYVLTITVLSNIVSDTNEVSGATLMINTIAALFIAYTFQPIKKYFDVLATKLLIKDYYDYEAFINEINDIIVNNADIKTLLNLVTSSINKNLSVEFADFYIEGNEAIEDHIIGENKKVFISDEWRDIQNKLAVTKDKVIINLENSDAAEPNALESNIGLLVKLLVNDELLGYLVLGQKKSGNNYTSKDIRAIEIIADEMAIAVQNMLRYDEIAKFNLTLQQKIDDATKELQQTNEKLRSLDEAKDEFISMASHQLRTPLTSVKGYISMLLEGDAGDLNDTQKKFLDQAFISSQRMVYLIADLLNVSRLKTGKFVIEKTPTYLPDVVESEISQLYETAKARELNLEFKKPSEFVTLDLDETKTRQVIMNFVDNAIYYTPRGGKITVALKQLKNSVEYTVTDTGIGVPKKEQHHLFTKFYRAGNAKKSRPDGTGLGLYMAKKVIIAQGGHIIFKTQEGKGSTFGFSFPIEPKE